MASDNFIIRDSVEYVYRQKHYGSRSVLRNIRKKMVALKLYFFIILLCAGAGAGANYFSEVKPKTQSLMGGLDQLQDMGENLSTDQKEKLKEQYGNMDLKGADMKDLMEKYKQMQGK